MLRVLILIPFYFCSALAVLPALIVTARLLRIRVGINPLVYTAIAAAIAGIVLPLSLDIVDLEAFRGRVLLVLVAASITLGVIDALLKRSLPLPLDEEMEHT